MPRPALDGPRTTYRHGDLRQALLDAGLELARRGGPDAVILREATRRAGVAPNAAYRHFENREALLKAVRAVALSAVATAMESELAALGPETPTAGFARASVRAVGHGYLNFAREQTGLFRTAFGMHFDIDGTRDPAMAGTGGLTPFELLSASLDRLVASGVLPAQRRPGAEYLAWSAVHGMAMLGLDGPLRSLDATRLRGLGDRLLDMVEKGL